MDRLVVVGQGYVGLPVAVRAVEAGFDVVGFDTDQDKIARLHAGNSIVEDIADDRLRSVLATGRLLLTSNATDIDWFDFAVISVPTPLRDGVPDLTYIESAAESIARELTSGATVILESTTYPGTTEELVAPILSRGSNLTPGVDFHLGYSPERIDPGNEIWTFERTPKVVSGLTPACLERISWFYQQLVDQVVPVRSPREAELTKLLENTFRHVNIALVNELAVFAHSLGIDIWDAIDAAATKPFGFMKFTPGPGVGGHCLPVDPSYLSWQVRQTLGQTFRFVELANDINDHMPAYVVTRIIELFNDQGLSVRGRRILVLGMAYKRNTSDARETPADPVIAQLVSLGADVRVADPHVGADRVPEGATYVMATEDEAREADLVLLLVDHDAFDLDALASASSALFDTRRCVSGDHVETL